MPTFTAIAFDRLIEPRESKSVDMPVPNSNPVRKSRPVPKPQSRLERRNSTSVVNERKASRPQITPALYATPETTPLPDSPTSFPPSPYIINHKRRGPRLMKSFSQADVASRQKEVDEGKANGDATKKAEAISVDSTTDESVTVPVPVEVERKKGVCSSPVVQERVSWSPGSPIEIGHLNSVKNSEPGTVNGGFGSSKKEPRKSNRDNDSSKKKDALKLAANSERDSECEDFYDPQESMSYASNTDGEDNAGTESYLKLTPKGEFYDAWEGISILYIFYCFKCSFLTRIVHVYVSFRDYGRPQNKLMRLFCFSGTFMCFLNKHYSFLTAVSPIVFIGGITCIQVCYIVMIVNRSLVGTCHLQFYYCDRTEKLIKNILSIINMPTTTKNFCFAISTFK